MLKTRIFKSLFAVLLPILVFATPVFAGEMSDWEWNDFNVQFSLPKEMKVEQATAEMFRADGGGLAFEIYPWKDPSETAESIAKDAFKTLAKDLEIDPKTATSTESGDIGLDGYKTFLVEGEGRTKEGAMIYGVVGIIDPGSDINFAAYIIMWSEDKEESLKNAVSILKSIKKMKK